MKAKRDNRDKLILPESTVTSWVYPTEKDVTTSKKVFASKGKTKLHANFTIL